MENSAVSAQRRGRPGDAAAEAFFAMEPDEVLLAILDDGRSPESRRIKGKGASARDRTREALEGREATRGSLCGRGSDSSSPGTLHGYLAVFNVWAEVDRPLDGNCMQRLAPGCLAKTIRESRDRMKANFMHGWNPQFGNQPLGPIEDIAEDSHGVHYTVPVFDNPDNRKLALGLEAGLYGSSYRLEVLAEDFNKRPGRSAWNPRGLPERTILEARLPDFGPVASPLYPSTSAGIDQHR